MLATYKDGHIICPTHGDLGEEKEARRQHKFIYQEGMYYCTDCLGEELAASEQEDEGGPNLRQCPYCYGMHQVEHIEFCPLNPHRV